MTNTNLPDHWTPTELVGAPAYLQRAAKDYAEAYALAALAQSGQGEAVLYVAQAQLDGLLSGTLPGCQNLGAERGVYLPVRPEAGGKFTAPLYTRPQPAQPARVVDEEYVERLRVALRFYARGEHYFTDDEEDFDTVSGEPENWLSSGLDDSQTMIEDGSVAMYALLGKPLNFMDGGDDLTPQPIEGELLSTPTAAPTICGMPVVIDESMPADQFKFVLPAPTPSQAAVTELDEQLAGALLRMCNAYALQKPPGSPMSDPEKIANAALAAFEAKKAEQP